MLRSRSGELGYSESGIGVGNFGKVGVGVGYGYFTSDSTTLVSMLRFDHMRILIFGLWYLSLCIEDAVRILPTCDGHREMTVTFHT